MFDNLNRGLEKAWDLVRKDGKLTKDNIKGPMREIRRALLEADVRGLSHKPWQICRSSAHVLNHTALLLPAARGTRMQTGGQLQGTACSPFYQLSYRG